MGAIEAHLKCLKNGLKVYPIPDGYGRWKICVEKPNGRKKIYDKLLRSTKEINTALESTLIYLANRLTEH